MGKISKLALSLNPKCKRGKTGSLIFNHSLLTVQIPSNSLKSSMIAIAGAF
jgi:hypothetical protein